MEIIESIYKTIKLKQNEKVKINNIINKIIC